MELEKIDLCEKIQINIVNSLKKVISQKEEIHEDFLTLLFPDKIDKHQKLLSDAYKKCSFSDELNDLQIYEDFTSNIALKIICSPLKVKK